MRLFAKKRVLVSVASVAIAAAVLLTGCGGDDGGSTGGGSTGGGNTGTTEPEPDPEPTPDPDPDPEPTPDPVDPDPVETTPEQRVVDVNTSVETNDGSITMSVTTGSGESTKVVTATAPDNMVYAPFNFNITNNSEKDIDLQENTQTMAMKARSLVSTVSADANYYDALFDGSHTAKRFDISLDGTKVDAENTASVIEVYDENNNKRDGTILKPGWKAIIKVVVKVPEAWSQEGSPLNVTYNLPSENVTDKEVYVFAVTPSGTPKKDYTLIPTIVPTEDGTYYDYQTIEATLNGEDGELVIFKTTAKNTTKNVFHVRNTVSSLGNVTLDAEDGLKADRIFKGTKVEHVTCESKTTGSDTESRTVITALDADHEGMYVGESGNVYAYVFVPASSGKWTRLDFYFNGTRIGYAERTVEPTPDPDPDPDPDPTPDPDKPSANSLKFTKTPSSADAYNLQMFGLNGYGVMQSVVIENVSDKAITLDGVYPYETYDSIEKGLGNRYQEKYDEEYGPIRQKILDDAGLSEGDEIPEDVQQKLNEASEQLYMKYMLQMLQEAYQIAQKYANKNVRVATSSGGEAWCITYLSEKNDHTSTTLQPGDRVTVELMIYSEDKANLLGTYYTKQLFNVRQSVLEKADQEEPDEPNNDDWYKEKDADDGQVYTKLPTYFLSTGSGGWSGTVDKDDNPLILKMHFSAEGGIRNTTAETLDLEHTFYDFSTDGSRLDETKMFPENDFYRYASNRYVIRVTMKSGKILPLPCVVTVKSSTSKLAPGEAVRVSFNTIYKPENPIRDDDWLKMEVYDKMGNPDLCIYRTMNYQYYDPSTQSSKVRVQSLPNEIKTPVTQ